MPDAPGRLGGGGRGVGVGTGVGEGLGEAVAVCLGDRLGVSWAVGWPQPTTAKPVKAAASVRRIKAEGSSARACRTAQLAPCAPGRRLPAPAGTCGRLR